MKIHFKENKYISRVFADGLLIGWIKYDKKTGGFYFQRRGGRHNPAGKPKRDPILHSIKAVEQSILLPEKKGY